MLRQNTIR